MIFLTKIQIVKINRLTVTINGGNFIPPNNFLNESALDYLIDAIQAEVFGQSLYPTIFDKTALYLYNIIANHIFTDGNKRTGLEACLIFLKINGYQLSSTVTDKILTDFILSIASGEQTLEQVQDWLKSNFVRR
jgi:death on curing protein